MCLQQESDLAIAEYKRAIRAAITVIAELPENADDRDDDMTETKLYLIALLESALARVTGTAPLLAPTATELGRPLVDGNGPQDPDHPVFQAIDDVGRTGSAATRAASRLELQEG